MVTQTTTTTTTTASSSNHKRDSSSSVVVDDCVHRTQQLQQQQQPSQEETGKMDGIDVDVVDDERRDEDTMMMRGEKTIKTKDDAKKAVMTTITTANAMENHNTKLSSKNDDIDSESYYYDRIAMYQWVSNVMLMKYYVVMPYDDDDDDDDLTIDDDGNDGRNNNNHHKGEEIEEMTCYDWVVDNNDDISRNNKQSMYESVAIAMGLTYHDDEGRKETKAIPTTSQTTTTTSNSISSCIIIDDDDEEEEEDSEDLKTKTTTESTEATTIKVGGGMTAEDWPLYTNVSKCMGIHYYRNNEMKLPSSSPVVVVSSSSSEEEVAISHSTSQITSKSSICCCIDEDSEDIKVTTTESTTITNTTVAGMTEEDSQLVVDDDVDYNNNNSNNHDEDDKRPLYTYVSKYMGINYDDDVEDGNYNNSQSEEDCEKEVLDHQDQLPKEKEMNQSRNNNQNELDNDVPSSSSSIVVVVSSSKSEQEKKKEETISSHSSSSMVKLMKNEISSSPPAAAAAVLKKNMDDTSSSSFDEKMCPIYPNVSYLMGIRYKRKEEQKDNQNILIMNVSLKDKYTIIDEEERQRSKEEIPTYPSVSQLMGIGCNNNSNSRTKKKNNDKRSLVGLMEKTNKENNKKVFNKSKLTTEEIIAKYQYKVKRQQKSLLKTCPIVSHMMDIQKDDDNNINTTTEEKAEVENDDDEEEEEQSLLLLPQKLSFNTTDDEDDNTVNDDDKSRCGSINDFYSKEGKDDRPLYSSVSKLMGIRFSLPDSSSSSSSVNEPIMEQKQNISPSPATGEQQQGAIYDQDNTNNNDNKFVVVGHHGRNKDVVHVVGTPSRGTRQTETAFNDNNFDDDIFSSFSTPRSVTQLLEALSGSFEKATTVCCTKVDTTLDFAADICENVDKVFDGINPPKEEQQQGLSSSFRNNNDKNKTVVDVVNNNYYPRGEGGHEEVKEVEDSDWQDMIFRSFSETFDDDGSRELSPNAVKFIETMSGSIEVAATVYFSKVDEGIDIAKGICDKVMNDMKSNDNRVIMTSTSSEMLDNDDASGAARITVMEPQEEKESTASAILSSIGSFESVSKGLDATKTFCTAVKSTYDNLEYQDCFE